MGLSQAELARRLGLSQKVISAYERDYRTPSSTLIPRVAETLGATPDQLYAHAEDTSKKHLRKRKLWEIVERLEHLSNAELDEIARTVDSLEHRKRPS